MPARFVKCEYFTYRAREWELTWYHDGVAWSCRVHYPKWNALVVDNAHLAPSPRSLLNQLDAWLADDEKRIIVYSNNVA